jgi:hypothetical protein
LILAVAGGLPECSGGIVFVGNQRGYSSDAATAEVFLTGPRQRDPNSLSPMSFTNSKPIQVASPPVPTGDQGADDLAVARGNQQSSRRIGDQVLDVLAAVDRGCMPTPRLSP